MILKRYGIATLCGGCGQRGGSWTPVAMDNGPFVMASECLTEIAQLKNERAALRTCVVGAVDLLKGLDVGYQTQAVLRAVLNEVAP